MHVQRALRGAKVSTKIPISERFLTVQGEGSRAGRVAYFIRTTGCNLRCWWCDTPYTSWKPEPGQVLEPEELASQVEREAPAGCDVVLTGGEPMLFSAGLSRLVRLLEGAGRAVTVETNGTIWDPEVTPHLWSVSPKLPSSAPGPEHPVAASRLHARNNILQYLAQFTATGMAQFKFVVTDQNDLGPVERLVFEHNIPRHDVWLMPQGVTAADVLSRGLWLAEECKVRGFNLSLRQHVLLWGHKRGV